MKDGMVVSVSVVYPRDFMVDWELPCPASQKSITVHIARLGEDQNSKIKVRCPLNEYFRTIVKSKNRQSNHR